MDVLKPVYTEQNDCQDCYKCIRECRLKAIKVVNNSAQIMHENCIFCGHCTQVCPVGAKKIRNDLNRVKSLLRRRNDVVVSLAPSFISEFPNLGNAQIVAAMKALGFSHVSETALGAQEISCRIPEMMDQMEEGIYISSACPSVVELIRKYYPQYTNQVTPLLSPLLAHCKILKQSYGEDTPVVFIGPCVAKKREADDFPELLEASLTFEDLKNWLKEKNIDPYMFPERENEIFEPCKANKGVLYPIDGGMIAGVKANATTADAVYMTFSGIQNIENVLKDLDRYKKGGRLFLELLACDGGCINGPGTVKEYSSAIKRFEVIQHAHEHEGEVHRFDNLSLVRDFNSISALKENSYSESEIKEALTLVGKSSDKDEINCGGCGYNSCREFAVALLEEKSEPNMCVSYMRKIAHDKSSALLQKIPSGVVIVNEDLKIIEANYNFARMLGEETMDLFETIPGLPDADLTKLVPFHKLFSSILRTGEENLERDVRCGNGLLHINLFTIQKKKMVGAILRDMSVPFIQREEVISRAREVNRRNLETVQKIAYLLGENASETEDMLNSIVEFYNLPEGGQ
ncbi:MAG: [Fe-Fe] hydrogenase large subunit C-terminal domain-containing protein [Marinifilaceae bacterium]